MSFQEHYPAWRQALAGGGWRGSGEELPAATAAWLLHQGSLTEKLRGRCGSLKVRIVRQGWFSGSLKTNEASFCEAKTDTAGLPGLETAKAGGVAAAASERVWLRDEPIGPWLFARRTRRQSLQWRRDEGGLYARRSMLLLEGSPLQISELFLPQFDFAG